jgi:hypothetical protein
MTKPYTKQTVAELRDKKKMPWKKIAERIGKSERTAQRWYKEAAELPKETKAQGKIRLLEEDNGVVDVSRFAPMTASGDMIVTCDWHIPVHDPALVNAVIRKAHEEDIKTLIIGGDYFNMDSFSSYAPHQKDAGIEIEREQGLLIMDALLDTFDDIYIFWGNHDYRFARQLNYKISFIYAIKWMLADLGPKKLDRLHVSDVDYMILEQEKTYRMSHQTNFSSVPLTVARKLATKYNQSIITAHSHHFAIGVALDGQNLCLEGGGLYDKAKTEYIQKTTTHHEWVPGFTMFKGGLPTLFSPVFGNL